MKNIASMRTLHAKKFDPKRLVVPLVLCVIVLALACTLVAKATAASTNQYGNAGTDYVAGQALVCVQGDTDTLQTAIDESCSDKTSAVYKTEELITLQSSAALQKAIAAGDDDKITELSIAESNAIAAGNGPSAAECCHIFLVDCGNTEGFLSAIANHGSILWAQPNYIRYATDTQESGTENNAETTEMAEETKEVVDPATQEVITESSEQISENETYTTDDVQTSSAQITAGQTDGQPNDPFFEYQWSLDATKFGGDPNKDIDYSDVYPFTETEETVVAVLDTGVAYDHEDIPMWGKGDQYPELLNFGGGKYGYNGNDSEPDPQPSSDPYDKTSGHGTHCSSCIAGTVDNNMGTAGVNNKAKIMACRFLGNNGSGDDAGAIRCYGYMLLAKSLGVNLTTISNSWGSNPANLNPVALEAVTTQAGMQGIASVFAAGNDQTNLDGYPNNTYHNPYVTVVGASESTGSRAVFSNYGQRMVDVFAPGTTQLCGTNEACGQYLPWLQKSSSNYFYDNFESTNNVTMTATYKPGSEFAKTYTAQLSQQVGTSYGNVLQADISDAESGEEFGLNIDIEIPTSQVEQLTDKPYLAFMYAIRNMNQVGRIAFGYYDSEGAWEKIGTYSSADKTMNVVSKLTDDKLCTTGDTIKFGFRGIFTASSENATPSFWIDNVGLGKDRIKYTYMQGTSMACPVTSGVTSIVAATTKTYTTAQDTLKNIAYVKGSAVKSNYLTGLCQTEGIVNVSNAYNAAKSSAPEIIMNPVMQDLREANDGSTATLTGYFFGASEGSLLVDDSTVDIQSWSDNSVVFTLPDSENHFAKFTLTNSAVNTSTTYFEVHEGVLKGFKELPVSDIEHEWNGIKIQASDLHPMRSASTKQYYYQLSSSTVPKVAFFECYNYKTSKWEDIDISELDINAEADANAYSLAAGVDEVYLLYTKNEAEEDAAPRYNIAVYNENANKWTHITDIDDICNNGSMIGLYKNELILCGADYFTGREDAASVYKIYPDTGKVYGNLPDIPLNIFDIWGIVGGTISTYGDTIVISDSRFTLDPDLTRQYAEKEFLFMNGPIIFDGEEWHEGDSAVYDTGGYTGLVDKSQNFYNAGAACADTEGNICDIVVGPVKNNGTSSMIDTWVYNSANDKQIFVDDEEQNADAAWVGQNKARFSSFKNANLSGVVHNNNFYIVGKKGDNYDVRFRSLDLSLLGLQSEDVNSNAKHELFEPIVPVNNADAASLATGDKIGLMLAACIALIGFAFTVLICRTGLIRKR